MASDASITDLLKRTPPLQPDDSVRRAVGVLRASGLPALPVVYGGRVVGLLSESDALARLLLGDRCEILLVSEAMRRDPACANPYMSAHQVADLLASSGEALMPVINDYGVYQGVVTRSDILGSMCETLRPLSPAGMATPLGVHLTTGAVTAGAGSLGLFLTGLSLFALIYGAAAISLGLGYLVQLITHVPVIAMLHSPPISRPNVMDLPLYLTAASNAIFMLLLLRLSPLSGYHAAEHQVVHTIESGEPLDIETVARMPRVHPRCGTNLLAAASIVLLLSIWFSAPTAILIGLVVIVLGWRSIGGYLQYFITTRNPSRKQLENGIAVGQELIERYRQSPNRVATDWERIWNMGFLQTAAGLAAGYGIDSLVHWLVGFSPFAIM